MEKIFQSSGKISKICFHLEGENMNKFCFLLFLSFFFLKCEIFSTPSKMTPNNIFPLNMKFQFLHILFCIFSILFVFSLFHQELIFRELCSLNKQDEDIYLFCSLSFNRETCVVLQKNCPTN